MSIESHIGPWSGRAVRHLPDAPGVDVLDFSHCGRSAENRWNVRGEPTLYLARNKAVALAEFARHFEENRTRELAAQVLRRTVYSLDIELERVLDLRDPKICKALSLTGAPHCFERLNVARATASFVRNVTSAQAVLVPSMAFLDRPDMWCLVVFLEKVGDMPGRFIKRVRRAGAFHVP